MYHFDSRSFRRNDVCGASHAAALLTSLSSYFFPVYSSYFFRVFFSILLCVFSFYFAHVFSSDFAMSSPLPSFVIQKFMGKVFLCKPHALHQGGFQSVTPASHLAASTTERVFLFDNSLHSAHQHIPIFLIFSWTSPKVYIARRCSAVHL